MKEMVVLVIFQLNAYPSIAAVNRNVSLSQWEQLVQQQIPIPKRVLVEHFVLNGGELIPVQENAVSYLLKVKIVDKVKSARVDYNALASVLTTLEIQLCKLVFQTLVLMPIASTIPMPILGVAQQIMSAIMESVSILTVLMTVQVVTPVRLANPNFAI